jgi:hypothetical protein
VVRSANDRRSVTVTRRSDAKIVLTHRPQSSGYRTAFADVFGDLLVVSDDEVLKEDGQHGVARSYIYNLRTGQRTAVADIPAALPPSTIGSVAAVTDNGRYFYQATRKDGTGHCVAQIELTTLAAGAVECSDDAKLIGMGSVKESGDGVTWTNSIRPDNYSDCAVGRFSAGDEVITDVAKEVANCGLSESVVIDGWAVWTGTYGSGMPLALHRHPIRAVRDGSVVDLGLTDEATLTSCDGYAYWRYWNQESAPIKVEVRRWKPGIDEVQTVYAYENSPGRQGQISIGGCADNILTISLLEAHPDTIDQVQTFALMP